MDNLNASQMSCLWCTDSEGMKSRLLEYCQEPPWADIVSRDFSFCQYCVTEYHEAKTEFLLQNKEKEEILTQIEINRLRKDFNSALNNSDLDPTELEDRLEVPIFEVLKYPYLLVSKEMDNVFCKAISTLQDSGHPPTVSELLPGLYLLFIHSQVKVRQWAKEAAKAILPIKAEEYEEIQLIVTWMLNVIDFDLFETPNMADMMEISSHSDCVLLPSHLFCSDSVRDYWQGVKMLLTSLDQGAVRNKLMRPNGQGGHRTLVDAVIFVMEKSSDVENCENSAFWPALECFILLLEKLEFRMWQYLSMSPDEVLKLITTHAVYLRQLQKLDNCKSQKAETDQCVPKESPDPQKKRNRLSLKKRSTSKTSSPRSSNSRGTVSDQFKRISVEDENLCSGFEDKLSQDSQREERLTVVFACFLPYVNSLLEFGCLATKTVSSTMKFLVQQAEHVFLSTEGTVSSPASSSKCAMDNSGATCHNRYQDMKNCAVCEQCITVLMKLLELLFTKKQYALTVPNASVWVQTILDYVKLMEKGKRLPDESTSKPSLKCHLQKKCEDLVLGLLKAGVRLKCDQHCPKFLSRINSAIRNPRRNVTGNDLAFGMTYDDISQLLDSITQILITLRENPPKDDIICTLRKKPVMTLPSKESSDDDVEFVSETHVRDTKTSEQSEKIQQIDFAAEADVTSTCSGPGADAGSDDALASPSYQVEDSETEVKMDTDDSDSTTDLLSEIDKYVDFDDFNPEATIEDDSMDRIGTTDNDNTGNSGQDNLPIVVPDSVVTDEYVKNFKIEDVEFDSFGNLKEKHDSDGSNHEPSKSDSDNGSVHMVCENQDEVFSVIKKDNEKIADSDETDIEGNESDLDFYIKTVQVKVKAEPSEVGGEPYSDQGGNVTLSGGNLQDDKEPPCLPEQTAIKVETEYELYEKHDLNESQDEVILISDEDALKECGMKSDRGTNKITSSPSNVPLQGKTCETHTTKALDKCIAKANQENLVDGSTDDGVIETYSQGFTISGKRDDIDNMQDFGYKDESTERREMSRTQSQLCSFKENRNTAGNVKGNHDDDVESAAVINSKDDEYDADNDSGTDNMEVDKKFPQGKAKIKSQKTSSVTKLTGEKTCPANVVRMRKQFPELQRKHAVYHKQAVVVLNRLTDSEIEKACKRTDQLDNISSEEDDDIPLLSLLEDKIASQEWRQRSTEMNDSDETNISSDDTTEERSSADSNCNHKQQDREAVVAETSESENSLEKLESSGHQISTASTRKDVRVKDVYSLSSTTVSTSESDRRSILPSKKMTPNSKSTPKKFLSSSSASIHNRARKSKPSPKTHSRSNRSFSTSSTECSAETSETENDSVRQSAVKTALTWKLQSDDQVIIISSDEESESEHSLAMNAKTDNEMNDRKTISERGSHFHASDSKAKSTTGAIGRSDRNSRTRVNSVPVIAVSQGTANNKDDAIEKLWMGEDADMEGKNYEPVTPTTQVNITPQRWKIVGDQETSSDSDFVEQEQLANRAVLDKSKSKPSLEDSDSDDAFSVAQRHETKMIEGHKKSSAKPLPFLQDQDKSSSKSKLPSLSRGNVQMAAGDTAKNTQKPGSKGVKFTAQYVADNIMEMDLRTSSDGSDFDDDPFVTFAAHDEAHKQAAKKKKEQHDISNQAQTSKRTPVHMGQRTSTLIEPRTLHMYRRGSKTQTEARHPRTTRLKSHPPPMPSLHKKPPPPSPLDCSKIAKNMTQLRANLVMRELAIQEKKLQDSTPNKNPLIFNRRRSLYAENNSPADGERVLPPSDVHEDELPGNQEKSDKETGAKRTAQTFGHRFASRTAGLAKTMSEKNTTVRQRRLSGKDDNTTSAVEEASHTAGEVTALSAEASRDNHTRIENHEAAYNAEQKNDNDSKTATTFQQSTVISGPVPRERPAAQTHKNPRWSDLELPDMTKVNKVSVEDYYEKILEWKPEWISYENFDASVMPGCLEPQKVPVTFDSPQHFYAVFQPLHLLETWAKILKDWHDVKDRKVFTGKMTSSPRPLEGRPSMSLLDCEVKTENRNLGALQGISECDFVRLELSLYYRTEAESIVKRHAIFGIVDKVLMDKTGDYASRNKENIDDNTKCKVQFRILSMNYAVADNTIEFQVITSLIPLLRQYNSFKIPQSNVLTRHILRPITKNVYTFTASDHSAPVELTRMYNKSQECCIQGATEAAIAPYAIPRVCMIQGPPGTGKSYTIVGIVHSILKHSKQRNISIPTANSNPNLNKINILLCAPSNAAIDQLMRKLVAHLMQLSVHKQNTKYNCGDYNIVRVGREYNVHPDVRKYLLDEIVKSRIAKARSGQSDVSKLYAELKDLDDRIGEAERLCSSFKIKGDRISLSGAEAQRDRLLKQRNELEKETKKSSSNARNLRGQESKVRQHVLVEADVVCCTLNGSGSSVLDSAVRMSKRVVFDCVIIDEACQCTELDSLIPLQYGSTKLILVGDPQQLPATVLSQNAQKLGFGQSLFERLYKFFRDHCDNPVMMLDTQYRMHKSICEFPSNQFYYGKLKTSSEVLHRTTQAKFPLHPFCVVDVVSGQERQDKPGAIINIQEAKFILEICRVISEIPRFTVNIGVITPYRAQKYHLEKQLRSEMCRGLPRIEVNTVDGFQGREKDVIILSCVRASPFGSTGIGFVANKKRLNVALTRAKYSLFIVGHLSSLETNDIWKKLIEDVTSRGIVMKATPESFRETAVKCLVEPSIHIARTSTSSDTNLAKQKNNSSKAPSRQDLSGQSPSTVNSHEKCTVQSVRTFDLSSAIFNKESVPDKRKARRASLNQEKQQERSTGGANSVAAADKRKKQDGNNQRVAIRSQRKSLDEVVGQISQKYYGGSKAVTLPSDRHSKSSNVEMRKSQTKEDGHVEFRAVSDDGVLQSKARGPNSLKNTSIASTEESGTAHSSSTSAFRTVESHTKTEYRRKRSSAEELRATAKLASSASKRGNTLPVTDQTQPQSKICIESHRANQSSRDRTSISSKETRKRKSCLTDPEEPKRSRTTKRVRFDPEVKDNTAESVRRSELYKRTHIRELPCFKKD